MLRSVLLSLSVVSVIGACQSSSPSAANSAASSHLGAPFGTSAEVTLSDLVTKPDDYNGKSVQVRGRIKAMCTHRKEWFAIVNEESGSTFVRVITAPGFLVPDGSIGKLARAEGVVEVRELPAETAKHFLGEHKLGDPNTVQGSVKQVQIRATAAELY